MAIRLYTFYTDLLADLDTVGQAQSDQKKRDQDLFQIMHVDHSIPFFPHDLNTFNKHKTTLENISQSRSNLCFAFVTEKSCMVLNKGNYYKFETLQHAQEQFYKVSANDIVMNLLNKYEL